MLSTLIKIINLFSQLIIFSFALPESLSKSRQNSITKAIEKVGPAVASVNVEQQLNSIQKSIQKKFYFGKNIEGYGKNDNDIQKSMKYLFNYGDPS